jgi:DNA-binding GntR family transcriptional regulator
MTAGEVLYERLREDILLARMKPDAKLTLGPISKRYDVSVPTIREVLNRLTSEALVVAEGQKGFRVAPISEQGLREVAHARLLLETEALRQSIARGGIEWEAAIIASHHKLAHVEAKLLAGEDVDMLQWKRFDRDFHTVVISACESSLLLQMHRDVFDKYLRYLAIALSFRGPVAITEHQEIMNFALQRNEAAAVQVLTEHIRHGVDNAIGNGVFDGI